MKQSYLLFAAILLFAMGCAVSKKVTNAAIGHWQYKITDTPNGDYAGTFIIQQNGTDYNGQITANELSSELNDIVLTDNQLTCNFDYMNYKIQMSGKFEGDSFRGNVTTEGQSFDMTAERIKN